MKNIPEILSPVGGFDQLMAAVENGADAIYLGGEFFNARINADNFDLENMSRAISYAHIRNVKVYVAMNTLIYDDELENALDYARQMYKLGVDALILQDLGIVRLIRKYLPEMTIHLSTQGSVYNLSGVMQAKEMGFDRVVLAREANLEEIKTICQANALEIEVFVHGALCMCYSGQCQLSRNMGGRSGNRGLCAQPCRLPFETDEGKVYLLSPKDISAIDYLGELSQAGVSSLKIEGRMKSPEYVAIVTGIYRKYLDIYAREGNYQVSDGDREALTQVFSRGDFTDGYLFSNPGDKLLSGTLPKHQGTYIGKVTDSNAGYGLINIRLEDGKILKPGDGIEIQNQSLPGNVITYIKEKPNGDLCIGDLKGEINPGDPVFKITDQALMEKARDTYKGNSWEAAKSLKKINVEMSFKAEFDGKPALTLCERDKAGNIRFEVQVTGDDKVERAINRPITKEKIHGQLEKLGDTPFHLEKVEIDVSEDISFPVSVVNKLRRDAVSRLIEAKSKGRENASVAEEYIFPVEIRENQTGSPLLELYFYSAADINPEAYDETLNKLNEYNLHFNEIRILYPVTDLFDAKQKILRLPDTVKSMPYIPNISKGKTDTFLEGNLIEVINSCREKGIYIGNLGWINEFKKQGVAILGDYGLNINNIEAENLVRELGFESFVPSLESFEGVENRSWMYEGAVPLMVTEHPVHVDFKEPKRDVKLKAKFLEDMEKSIIVKNGKGTDYKKIREYMDRRTRNLRIFMGSLPFSRIQE